MIKSKHEVSQSSKALLSYNIVSKMKPLLSMACLKVLKIKVIWLGIAFRVGRVVRN